ncbi:MAG: CYTH domain-containing protein [Mesorhizobium sp.]|nr:CYTH domain-containing protein [Mesorhizobium sp.]MBL8576840.1 CYTH domain-containing protein [Mesorhizobium sp.]
MAKEIERKFLVADAAWRDHVEAEIEMRQFYLAAGPGRTIRIRINNGIDAILTLKFSGPGRGRDEFEYAVPLPEALEMQAFALGRVIEKTRHHVRFGGYLYEVDVFAGSLTGLVIAELETPDIVPTENLPPWLGRDVTNDGRYYNAYLALGGGSGGELELAG